MLEILAVRGGRDVRRFIDYAYTRNRSDPHWVPPLRLGERDRLNRKKNPFFRTPTSNCSSPSATAASWAGSSRSTTACTTRPTATTLAMFGLFEVGGCRDGAGAARAGRAVGEGARTIGRPRSDQPVDERQLRPARRRLRYRPDAADAAQPAGIRDVHRSRRLRARSRILYAWIYDLHQTVPETVLRIAERRRERLGLTIRPIRKKEFIRDAEQPARCSTPRPGSATGASSRRRLKNSGASPTR